MVWCGLSVVNICRGMVHRPLPLLSVLLAHTECILHRSQGTVTLMDAMLRRLASVRLSDLYPYTFPTPKAKSDVLCVRALDMIIVDTAAEDIDAGVMCVGLRNCCCRPSAVRL